VWFWQTHFFIVTHDTFQFKFYKCAWTYDNCSLMTIPNIETIVSMSWKVSIVVNYAYAAYQNNYQITKWNPRTQILMGLLGGSIKFIHVLEQWWNNL
jgi:hypothetical protein